MSGKTPLITREDSALIACNREEFIEVRLLRQQLHHVISALPGNRFAINVCADRLNFLRAMLSVIGGGGCNLLPANKQEATILNIADQYPDSYVLHDGKKITTAGQQQIDITELMQSFNSIDYAQCRDILVPEDQPAAISFTSGSTGESRPNLKTWSTLRQGNEINVDNMLIGAPTGLHMLTTVPPQHMYGLELSILLPLTTDTCVHAGQPLFPIDIVASLTRMPPPRALVSTPQHLRAMLASGLSFPQVSRIYSATAPLDQKLAQDVEKTFNGRLIEIYGCSEIGSLARRETARESAWTPFSAMTLNSDGEHTSITAPHVSEVIQLQDRVTLRPDGKFELGGRQGDLINIAGKRGSIGQITKFLLAINGVEDAVVFDPDVAGDQGATKRLASLVVAPTLDKKSILDELRKHIDPVFLPRPIYLVDRLPRSESSKLPREAVLAMYQKLRAR